MEDQSKEKDPAKSSSNGDHEDAAHCKPSVDSVSKSPCAETAWISQVMVIKAISKERLAKRTDEAGIRGIKRVYNGDKEHRYCFPGFFVAASEKE